VQGCDSPRLKMFFPEVPEVEGHDDGSPAGDRRCKEVPVLLVVLHAGNQWLMAPSPSISKVERSSLWKWAVSVEGHASLYSSVRTVSA